VVDAHCPVAFETIAGRFRAKVALQAGERLGQLIDQLRRDRVLDDGEAVASDCLDVPGPGRFFHDFASGRGFVLWWPASPRRSKAWTSPCSPEARCDRLPPPP